MNSNAPTCSCSLKMVKRQNKITGKSFWGCIKFGKGGCGETASHEDAIADDDAQPTDPEELDLLNSFLGTD